MLNRLRRGYYYTGVNIRTGWRSTWVPGLNAFIRAGWWDTRYQWKGGGKIQDFRQERAYIGQGGGIRTGTVAKMTINQDWIEEKCKILGRVTG